MLIANVRRGLTLVELLVSMTITGVALALLTSIMLRQQRIVTDLADAHALTLQLRDGATTLPIDLAAIAPRLGDIREARDTALELRATLASAVVCDTVTRGVILTPSSATTSFTSITTSIAAGDSLWLLTVAADSERWTPYRITNAATVAGGDCSAEAPALAPTLRSTPRSSLTLAPAPNETALGMPVRITRAVRYSIYRASDGGWYAGERDWNASTSRFNTIQPLAGPFLSVTASRSGLSFRYLDSMGVEIATPVADPRSIAAIRIALRGQTRAPPRALSVGQPGVPRQDSTISFVAFRNRR